jgi:hypothetical protein
MCKFINLYLVQIRSGLLSQKLGGPIKSYLWQEVEGGVRRDPVTILAKVERSLMPVVGARVECYIQVGSVVSI